MFSKLKKIINYNVRLYRNIIDASNEVPTSVNIKVPGVKKVVLYNKAILSVGIQDMPAAALTNDGYIIVNNEFMNSPKSIQKVIIEHELGHLKANHKGSLKSFIKRRIGHKDAISMEIQADSNVSDKLILVSLLEDFKERLSSTKELTMRIDYVKGTKEYKQQLIEQEWYI